MSDVQHNPKQKSPTPEKTPMPETESAEVEQPDYFQADMAHLMGAQLTAATPPPIDRNAIMRLQSKIGNQALQRVLGSKPESVTHSPEAIMRQATTGTGTSVPYREEMEHAFGEDLSGVQVFTGQSDAMASIQANAATQGENIAFAADNPTRELVAHEVTHVIQNRRANQTNTVQAQSTVSQPHDAAEREAESVAQKAIRGQKVDVHVTPTAGIHRSYAALGAMGKARVDSLADRKYREKTEELEFALGSIISKEASVHAVVDKMLAMFKQMADAWAKKTGQTHKSKWLKTVTVNDEFYEQEFAYALSEKYYGSFEKTATSIKKVFSDKSQPLRKKLHLIYNAVRNNNFAKYLKMAAMELEAVANGNIDPVQKIMEASGNVKNAQGGIDATQLTERTLEAGFAEESGLKTSLEKDNNLRQKYFSAWGEKEKFQNNNTGQKDVLAGHDLPSNVMNFSAGVSGASGDRLGAQSDGLGLDEQRSLKIGDVEDITSAEIRQLSIAKGEAAPKINKSAKKAFKRQADTKIAWEQGREYYDVVLNSEVDKQADQFSARLEAGISGSTDLMMHAGQHLALEDNDMKTLRLAMVGWMLSNHDHSFYEIMIAAQNYGQEFKIDAARLGYEYEAPENFYPMEMEKVKNALPEKQYPSYFVSPVYKDQLSTEIDEPEKAKGDFAAELNTDGIPPEVTGAIDERATAEMQQLNEIIKKVAGTIRITEATAEPKRKQIIRFIKEDPAYLYFARKFAVHADAILNAMVTKHLGGAALSDTEKKQPALTADGLGDNRDQVIKDLDDNVGIPGSYLVDKPDYIVYAVKKLYEIIKADTPAYQGGDPDQQGAIVESWQKNPNLLQMKTKGGAAFGDRMMQLITMRLFVSDEMRNEQAAKILQIEAISKSQKTSGMWFSWGGAAMLQGWVANAANVKDYSFIANTSSPQGPGLYIATDAFRSQTYGEAVGNRAIVAILKDTPTISNQNAEQKEELRKIGFLFHDLYEQINHADILLWYGAGFARLSTSIGVKLTMNLADPDIDQGELKTQYGKLTSDAAKANFKAQAQQSGVDVSTW